MPVSFFQHRVAISNVSPFRNVKSRIKYNYSYSKGNSRSSILRYFIICIIFIFWYNNSKGVIFQNSKYKALKARDIIFYTEHDHHRYLQRINNKLIKSINGNRNKFNKIKIMQYNKGNSNFSNHTHFFQNILEAHQPHIMCVSEANFKRKDREHYFNDFLGYKIETNLQYEKIGVSRNCILIREGLKYKRRMDLEDETNCDIWIEISGGVAKTF